MAKVVVEVDDQELWDAVTNSSFELCPWYLHAEQLDDRLIIEVQDPDDELGVGVPITTTLRVGDLAVALSIAIDKGYTDPGTGLSLLDWVQGKCDMDAVLGDLVMQAAVFGEVLYG